MNLIKSSSFDYYKTRMEQAIKEIHRLSLLFESNRSQPVGDKHLWMQWLIRHIATHLYGMLTTHTHRIRTCTWVAKIIIPPLTPYLTRPSESRLRPTWRKDENYFVLFGSLKVPIAPYPKNIARKYQQQSWFGNNTDNRYVDNPKTPFPPPGLLTEMTHICKKMSSKPSKKRKIQKWKHKRGREKVKGKGPRRYGRCTL